MTLNRRRRQCDAERIQCTPNESSREPQSLATATPPNAVRFPTLQAVVAFQSHNGILPMTRFLAVAARPGQVLARPASLPNRPIAAIVGRIRRSSNCVGSDDARSWSVTGKRADGREVDSLVRQPISVASAARSRVDATGRVFPLASGSTEITVSYDGKTVKVPLTAEKMEAAATAELPEPSEPDLYQTAVARRAAVTAKSPVKTASGSRCSASTRLSITRTC